MAEKVILSGRVEQGVASEFERILSDDERTVSWGIAKAVCLFVSQHVTGKGNVQSDDNGNRPDTKQQ